MKKLLILIAALQLVACATKETEHITPVPGEKPAAIVAPTGLKVAKAETVQPPKPAAAAQPGGAIEWDPNPPTDQVTQYRIYRLAGGSPPKLEGTTTTTTFRPAKKGTFYVTAVNGGGESIPSEEIKL